MNRNRWKKAVVVLAAASMLSGCKKGVMLVSEVKTNPGYSKSESMIVLAAEKDRYQNMYTDKVWDIEINSEMTFEEYLANQVEEFLIELRTINLLADEREITLSGEEQEKIRLLSEEYYTGLSDESREYLGASLEDALKMYTEYYKANKVVKELTAQESFEISDNEAKIIVLDEIELSSEEKAQSVYEKALEEGADFQTIAKENSINPEVRRSVKRGEEAAAYEEAAFALTEGEVSEVIEADGSYYVLKSVDDYDEKATLEWKKELVEERKQAAFKSVYDKFKEENPVIMKTDTWNQAGDEGGTHALESDFFELYKKYFPD